MKKSQNKKTGIDNEEKMIKEALCTDFISKLYCHLNHMSSKEKNILEFLWTISISAVTAIITVLIFKRT